jgi:hypothetical protein
VVAGDMVKKHEKERWTTTVFYIMNVHVHTGTCSSTLTVLLVLVLL